MSLHRRNGLGWVIFGAPIALAAGLWAFGLPGASIVYDSTGEHDVPYGLWRFPAATVRQLRIPGTRLHTPDVLDLFWGGMPAGATDSLIVVSGHGVHMARGVDASGAARGYFYAGASVPHWQVLMASIVVSGILYATVRPTLRGASAGTCHDCGYLLRGLPSSVCPECGENNWGRRSEGTAT